jgi:Abnormal spindle-like microcephaly-assoc'd, ASPM-SPD-2-Hydin
MRRVSVAFGIVVLLSSVLVAPAGAVDTDISISTTSVDFGDVDVGTTAGPVAVTLTNTGGDPFGPINMFGGAPPSAEFNASQNCQGMTLPAGGSCQVSFSFSPGAAGPYSDTSAFTVSETNNQSDGEDFTVALSGHGGPASPPPPPPPPVIHERTVVLKLRGSLVAKGRVKPVDPAADYPPCQVGITVDIQRKRDRVWHTIDTSVTDAEGRYREPIPDRAGKYRALARKLIINNGADICHRDVSTIRNRTIG